MAMKSGWPLLILTLGMVVTMQATAGAENLHGNPLLEPIDAPSLPPSSLPNIPPMVLPETPKAAPAAPAVIQAAPATPAKKGQTQTEASQ